MRSKAPVGRPQHQPQSAMEAVKRSQGQSLEPSVKAFMESRFGHDFSNVRVHSGPVASEAANEAGVHAYAEGRNIIFGNGNYNPTSAGGRKLLAHELTHVVQQRADRAGGSGAAEREADSVGDNILSSRGIQVNGQAHSGVMQGKDKNPLDESAKKIIEAAKDATKPIDKRAIEAVNSILKQYYDPAKVDSVVYKEDEPGLSTSPVGKGDQIKGQITVGKNFVDNVDSFARRVLQVGHELEHVQQQRDGKGGSDKKNEREFLAFYWEATQPEKAGTGRVSHATRRELIDEALRNYYCMPEDVQKSNAAKKDELLTLRQTEDAKGGNGHKDPPTSCPARK